MDEGIIADADVLQAGFVPERLLHREAQVKALGEAMLTGNCFLWGPPGVGKTCVSRQVAGQIAEEQRVQQAYVNCWKHSSKFAVMHEAVRQAGRFVLRKGIPYDEVLDQFRQGTGKRVVILDEFDKLEDDGVIYDLISADGVSVVLIANGEHALGEVDERIRSRLAGIEAVEFPHYTDQELVDILRERARSGLRQGAITERQLEWIADAAAGDCRAAIALLKKAAELAERKGGEAIGDDVVGQVVAGSVMAGREESPLNEYQNVLLGLVGSGGIAGGRLFQQFQQQCAERGLAAIKERTFNKYMEGLVHAGLVKTEGTGRWRVYRR